MIAALRVASVFLLAAALCPLAGAVWHSGTELLAPMDTVFLSKFCFDFDKANGTAGLFNITLQARALDKATDMYVLLFDDEALSYPGDGRGWDSMPCEVKARRAKSNFRLHLDPRSADGDTAVVTMTEMQRPRWWYVAITLCSPGTGSAARSYVVDYTVHTWNPRQGWRGELSMDDMGLVACCKVYVVVYGVLLATQMRAVAMLKQSGKDRHPVVILLTVGVLSALGSVAATCAYYYYLAATGRAAGIVWTTAKVVLGQSKFTIASIMLLVSRGRCISCSLKVKDMFWLGTWLLPFYILCFLLEAWGEWAESRRYTTGYVYATPVGMLLIAMDLGLLGIYWRNLQQTRKAELDYHKGKFYSLWGSSFALWFLSLPFVTLFAVVVPPWVRHTMVWAVAHAAHAMTVTALVVALWPSSEQNVFVLDMYEVELATVIGDSLDEPNVSEGLDGGWQHLVNGG